MVVQRQATTKLNSERFKVKYELTTETTTPSAGSTLYRIRALKDIPLYGVIVGDLGGFLESETNLSQEDDCWVRDNAMVYGGAKVYGDALIKGEAQVFGYARVYGDALVCGHARVGGNFRFSGDDMVSGLRDCSGLQLL